MQVEVGIASGPRLPPAVWACMSVAFINSFDLMLLQFFHTDYLHAAAVTSGTLCARFLFCSSPKPPDITYWVHLVHFPVPSAHCILLLAPWGIDFFSRKDGKSFATISIRRRKKKGKCLSSFFLMKTGLKNHTNKEIKQSISKLSLSQKKSLCLT